MHKMWEESGLRDCDILVKLIDSKEVMTESMEPYINTLDDFFRIFDEEKNK